MDPSLFPHLRFFAATSPALPLGVATSRSGSVGGGSDLTGLPLSLPQACGPSLSWSSHPEPPITSTHPLRVISSEPSYASLASSHGVFTNCFGQISHPALTLAAAAHQAQILPQQQIVTYESAKWQLDQMLLGAMMQQQQREIEAARLEQLPRWGVRHEYLGVTKRDQFKPGSIARSSSSHEQPSYLRLVSAMSGQETASGPSGATSTKVDRPTTSNQVSSSNRGLKQATTSNAKEDYQAKRAFLKSLDSKNCSPEKATMALGILGRTCRGNDDPFIDATLIQDPGVAIDVRGGRNQFFPDKLFALLQKSENDSAARDVITWLPHGRALKVHNTDVFEREFLLKYFDFGKWTSFVRQLNLWGFSRINSGPDMGGYYHELFLKGHPNLLRYMRRVGASGSLDRRNSRFADLGCLYDPDFYSMQHPEETKIV